MRKLMCFTLGFGMACGVCTYCLWGVSLLPYGIGLMVCGLTFLFICKRVSLLNCVPIILLGAGCGTMWCFLYSSFFVQPISPLDGTTVHLSVTASGYSTQTRYSYAVEGTTKLEGRTYKVLVYQKDDTLIQPGDILKSDFRIRVTAPQGERESSYYQGNGLFLVASQKGSTQIVHSEKTDIRFLPAKIARQINDALDIFFPSDTVSFARALFLGDTSGLTYQEDTALKIGGIRHIVAVSGLHVSLIYGLLLLLFGSNRYITALLSVPVLLFFAAMTGFTPSVTRACLMTGLMAIGSLIYEEYDSITGLSFAALLMLLINPFVIKSVSFQLSVSSVAGILLFASPIYYKLLGMFIKTKPKRILVKIRNWVCTSLAVSVSSQIFTLPLSAYYFNTISLVGVLTNLLTIWIVSFLFCGVAIVAALGQIIPVFCQILASLLSWGFRYVMFVAKVLSGFSFAAVYTQSEYIRTWLSCCYILLILFFILGRKRLGLYLSLGFAGLVVAISLSIIVPQFDEFRLTVIDVGEGQSILIQSGRENFLIDCGGDNDATAANSIAQTLLCQGISHLDGIALTHYDRDHSGAMENLLSRISVDELYLPSMEDGGFIDRMVQLNPENVVLISEETRIQLGDGILTLTEPGNLKTSNENCMCVLFESEKCDILITGDRGKSGEKRLIKSVDLPDVDILIAGHHGSKNSTCDELLEAVSPEIVIISVGKTNTYGHPAQELLDRLSDHDCTVYRTDLQGSVLVRRRSWQRNRFRTGVYSN